MDKPFLPKLKGMLNSPHLWDAFVEKLEYDIEQHQRKLEQATEMSDVFKAQGAIVALRQLKYLKEEINGLSK
jgi:division protein CdvB (Snf7/Vps24/ESCRT-III family)